VWAEDAEAVTTLRSGGDIEVPVWIQQRLNDLGRDISEWQSRRV
jgi:hypothetical protein